MKRNSFIALASTAFLFISTSACTSAPKADEGVAAASAPKDPDRVECRSGGDVRWLEVERKPVGCAFYYAKLGRRDRVAASTMGPQECVNSMHEVRKNLLTSGFRCEEMDLTTEAPPASHATLE